MRTSPFILLLRFLIILIIQVVFFKNVALGGHASSFIYLWFLLLLPLETTAGTGIVIGFVCGLIIDFFFSVPGIHAGACTIFMFVRPSLLKVMTPRGGYEMSQSPTFFHMGWPWFLIYSFSLILVHHLTVFSLEIFSKGFIGLILVNSLTSTLFTWTSVAIIILLSSFPKR